MNLKEEGKVSPEALMVMYLDEIAGRLADLSADFKSKEVAIQSVRIAPISEIIWEDEEIEPGTTAIIDTFGAASITLYIEVSRSSRVVLADVSRDKKSWRSVEEPLKDFESADFGFFGLRHYSILKRQEVLMYRYLRLRLDSEFPVTATLEMTGKPIPWEEPFPKIVSEFPAFRGVTRGDLREELYSVVEPLSDIREQLANAGSWEHYHKTVTATGTPVNLSSIWIPDGCQLVVKSMDTNTGAIYLGKSEDATKSVDKRVTLSRRNESTTFKVNNADLIWIDAEVDGEGIEYWSEEK